MSDYIYKQFKHGGAHPYQNIPDDNIRLITDAVKWLLHNNLKVYGLTYYSNNEINPYSYISVQFNDNEDLLAFTLLFGEVLE